MQPATDIVTRVSDRLLRWRWPIMALIGLFNILVESAERRSSAQSFVDGYYVWEILLFGFVGPALGGIALTWLDRARRRQRHADYHRSLHRELLALLGEVETWDDLIALVVRFPRRVVDLRGAGLLVHDPVHDHYHVEAQWWDPSQAGPASPTSLADQRVCDGCAALETALSGTAWPTRCAEVEDPALGDRYCLPLVHGGRLMALLYLFLPPGMPPTEEEASTLSVMAASMALAIHDAQPQRSARIQAEAAEAERQRIARDLHDTLGQSLGYLNLKLEQLAGEDTLHEIQVIRRELEQMRAVAGEAYLQVRTALSSLQSETPPDIETALQAQVQQAAARAGFEVKMAREGAPRPLPPQTRRHLCYLLGEAVANVEKHAGAGHVELQLTWTDEHLHIRLSDDGSGFDTGAQLVNGHYGLTTMQQRAQAVGGDLTIASSPGSGTEVHLFVPVAPQSPAPGEPR
jgi:signal transduction histidine kinase